MSERMKLLMFVAFLVAMGLAFELTFGAAPNPCTTYNEMRQIHIETNGEYGWPKGAVKECEDETQ